MDFSNVNRSLDSLIRRKPPLNETIIQRAQDLLVSESMNDPTKLYETIQYFIITTTSKKPSQTISNNDNQRSKNDDDVVVTSAGMVLSGIRWEPLAVGLYLGTEWLHQQNGISINPAKGGTTASDVDNNEKDITKVGVITNHNTTNTVYVEGPRVPSIDRSTTAIATTQLPIVDATMIGSLCDILHEAAVIHLEHTEPRIRTLLAKSISAYMRIPSTIWTNRTDSIESLHTRIVTSIHEHIESGRDVNNENYSRSSDGAMDDVTGWRALETNWLALANMIATLQGSYISMFGISSTLLQDFEFSTTKHPSRHIRAASMVCFEQILRACKDAYLTGADTNDENSVTVRTFVDEILLQPLSNPSSKLRKTIVTVLNTGLSDNWSQVRMAASVLCRELFVTLMGMGNVVDDIYPTLLPRMCFNRFYPAHGVKFYSHDTWKLIFKESGLPKLVNTLPTVCRYYSKTCDADNHIVREAACQAISELVLRLGESPIYHDKLQTYINILLQALIMCFHDEAWPVRDAACLSCGIMCRVYPEECRPELTLLWDRWKEQITDQIWSVRENAAVSLGDALEAYGPEFVTKIREELIQKLLPSAKNQPAMTRDEYKKHINDVEAHTMKRQVDLTDESIPQKLRSWFGCSLCIMNRPKAPWEATDGCIYLIRELCYKCSPPTDGGKPFRDDIVLSDSELKPLLQELADCCRVQHFPQADELRTTLWKCLPVIARSIGKERFKRYYFDIFLDLLFANLESRTASQLSIHAAGQCMEELATFVGPSIFRGRLEDYQIEIFDRTLRERQRLPKGPSAAPVGPESITPYFRASAGC